MSSSTIVAIAGIVASDNEALDCDGNSDGSSSTGSLEILQRIIEFFRKIMTES